MLKTTMSDDKVLQLLEDQQNAMHQKTLLLQQMTQLLQAQGVASISNPGTSTSKAALNGIIVALYDRLCV